MTPFCSSDFLSVSLHKSDAVPDGFLPLGIQYLSEHGISCAHFLAEPGEHFLKLSQPVKTLFLIETAPNTWTLRISFKDSDEFTEEPFDSAEIREVLKKSGFYPLPGASSVL